MASLNPKSSINKKSHNNLAHIRDIDHDCEVTKKPIVQEKPILTVNRNATPRTYVNKKIDPLANGKYGSLPVIQKPSNPYEKQDSYSSIQR